MSNLLPSVLGGLTEALVGGLVGFLVAYFAFRLRRSDKVIDYYTNSFPFLKYRLPSALQITVPETVLVADAEDEERRVAVETAYGFSVKLTNTGTKVIEDCIVEMQLDGQGKIVECRTIPRSKPGFRLCAERDQETRNIARASIPYINPGSTVWVHLLSVDNRDDTCRVHVLAKGARVRERQPSEFSWSILAQALRETAANVGIQVLLFVSTFALYFLGRQLLREFGQVGHTEQRDVFVPPPWFQLGFILVLGIQAAFIFRTATRAMRDRSSG